MLKKFRQYFLLIPAIAVGIMLILNDFLVYGIVVIGVIILFIGLWNLFLRSKEDEIIDLRSQLTNAGSQLHNLQDEIEELKQRRLNVTDIKHILDLGLLEIKTNFTRTWNQKFKEGKRDIHFIGALQVDLIAKYGIDLKELRIKYEPGRDEVQVANVDPKFLSFASRKCTWKVAEMMEYRKPFIGANHWRTNKELERFGDRLKEELREETEKEVENGPEELKWVLEPLKQQISNTLQILLGTSEVKFVDDFDASFQLLREFTNDTPEPDDVEIEEIN